MLGCTPSCQLCLGGTVPDHGGAGELGGRRDLRHWGFCALLPSPPLPSCPGAWAGCRQAALGSRIPLWRASEERAQPGPRHYMRPVSPMPVVVGCISATNVKKHGSNKKFPKTWYSS